MRRRLVTLATTGLATALVLSGCAAGGDKSSGADGGTKGSITLTFLTFETPNLNAKYWDDAIARASAKVPGVTIKKLVAPSADRAGYAKQLAASGQLADIMIAVSPNGFAQAGQLAPWSDQQLADFVSPHSNPIGGKIYQLPYNTQPTPLVYYNKTDFAHAGIGAPPKTYQELLNDCAKLKAKGINPFVVGGGGKDTWADMYPLIGAVATDTYQKTPDWLSRKEKGSAKFTDPAFVKAAEKVSDLAKRGYVDTAGLSRSYADDEQAFRDNKGAMYPMGSWFAASADAKKPDFDIGVFAWPSDDGSLVVPAYTGGGMSVSSKAANVALAQKWALAFMLDKTSLDASVRTDGSIIALKDYTPPAGMGPVYDATLAVYQQAVKQNAIVNAFSIETGDGSLPAGVADKAAAGVADLINGKKSAADFGAFLDSEWAKANQ
ncbi:extracellular solute-binding protein [Streptomyces sp. SID13666]|uniref:ABC transporter substrate-binding protein n=1 Tax=unclassified Streptomyces TaxID=2593676 RepID=UPI0013BFB8D6|nr:MULTISPECIES: extracellular solute-binding protein [unclassified Streptomyces]NEA56548.1 extracellular solute-binding protein [Streptomyces sp. SID13666]NEA72342.1 extracellular solute-binding protein [Streptomyces sp. SID13588]